MIKLWDIENASVLRMFSGHTKSVMAVSFSPDDKMILSGGADKTARLWDLETGILIRTFSGHDSIESVAFSPDGTKILTGSGDDTAKLWEVSTGSIIRTFWGHTDDVLAVDISPDGTRVLTGSQDETAKLWDISDLSSVLFPLCFRISDILSPQVSNQPFVATIQAINPNGKLMSSYSGWVNLTVRSSAKADPNRVYLRNGTWTGTVTIDQACYGTSLVAYTGGITGESNQFDVISPSTRKSVIHAKVLDIDGKVAFGASVRLTRQPSQESPNGTTYEKTINFPLDSCAFPQLEAGLYTLLAEKNSYQSEEIDFYISPGKNYTQTLYLRSMKQPILFVPGFYGSTSALNYFDANAVMVKEYPAFQSQLKIHNPLNFVGWTTLRDLLTEDYEIYDVPWDWRVSLFKKSGDPNGTQPAWKLYLKPVIEEAKKRHTSGKVWIVAHSMGGLLTRSYIESVEYENDIGKFAIVGTPHLGAGHAYYVWEGGDAELADKVGIDRYPSFNLAMHSATLKRLFGTMKGKRLDLDKHTDVLSFVREYVPTVGELMPLFDVLRKDGQPKYWSGYLGSPLYELNQTFSQARSRYESIETKFFISNAEPTIEYIEVGRPGKNGLYPDGVPINQKPYKPNAGDGTVHKMSAFPYFFGTFAYEDTSDTSHVGLVKAYASEITSFLTGQPSGPELFRKVEQSIARQEMNTPESQLTLVCTGRVQPLLRDPQGRSSGRDPENDDLKEDIPGTSLWFIDGMSSISVEEPQMGLYEVRITGATDDDFVFILTYGAQGLTEEVTHQWIVHDDVRSFTFNLDAQASPQIVAYSPLPIVEGLQSEPEQGKASLNWTAVNDPSVVAYHVYGKKETSPSFALLGTSGQPIFQTDHNWIEDQSSEDPTWYYVVLAADEQGKESFFSEGVYNKIPLRARFEGDRLAGAAPLKVQFTDLSEGTVTSRSWDLNNDGMEDSTEANPTFTYAEPGDYSVSLTVEGPLGSETSVEVGYITVKTFEESPSLWRLY